MFRRVFSRNFVLSVLISIIGMSAMQAQVAEHELPQLKERAMKSYSSGEYAAATGLFEQLIKHYPQDAMYRYYAGVCKVRSNRDIDKAIEYLYFSSTRGVPEDVFFFLAEAYRQNYDFEKAKEYYIKFDKEASRSQAKELNSKLHIRSMNSAQTITALYNPFKVLNVTFINLQDPDQYEQIKMKGGQLSEKPQEFFYPNEEKNDLNALMFMPKTVERGQYVYFSGLSRGGKDGYQIMQAKKGNTGKWTAIEAVDALNSDLDEIMPYYDPVGKDLYFASNGLEGLGGFDLYKAHYNAEKNEWSAPVNLGFPVNSVYDDYLLLPGTDLGMVMFFSARQASDTAMAVYKVQLSEPKKSLNSASPSEIRQIANLGGVAEELLAEYEAYNEAVAEAARKEQVAGDEEEQKTMVVEDVDPKYQALVAKALSHQSVSDSLRELSSTARIKVRDSKDPNDRWLYQKQIIVWERRAEEEQAEADILFAQVADFKPETLPDVIEKDTVIRELTVYKFVEPDSISSKAKQVFSEKSDMNEAVVKTEKKENSAEKKVLTPPVQVEKETQVAQKDPKTYKSFEMLEQSPYAVMNPIPMDIELPGGSFYRIQLGVFSKPADFNTFGGLTPITGESMPDRNLFKYYVGKFSYYDDAQDALQRVRSAGFQDAFVVSWFNGGKMSVEKVRKLEK